MNSHLQRIFNLIKQSAELSAEDKSALALVVHEVEVQKRALEIESSLERVRTVALSMNKRDDMLLVCRVISAQLESLNVKEIRNIQTAIFYEEKGTYSNFEYYAFHDKWMVTEVEYKNHLMSAAFAHEMISGAGKVFIHSLEGKEMKDWYDFQKTTNQFIDTHLEVVASLNYYWFSLGPVALGISTYSPLKEEEIELFKRFRNVFELAYRRFLDIKQAEEQSKEARIELALERVRARTMAMQKSEEMVDASHILFNELNALGIEVIRTGIATVDAEHETMTVWSSQFVEKNDINILGIVPRQAHPFFEAYYTAWKKKESYFTFSMAGDEVKSYYTTMSPILSYPLQSEFNPKETFSIFFFPEGSLNVISRESLSEESCQLLIRFARVFGLIYRRFLDLKQTEVQAREAQIQLALERVRARTMAMQKSDELSETAYVLFQQFKDLGENLIQIHIGIINEEEGAIEFHVTDWKGGGSKNENTFKGNINEPNLLHKMYVGWKAGKKSTAIALAGKELSEWMSYRSSFSGVPDPNDYSLGRRVVSVGFFSKGTLSFSTIEPPPEESIQLLERFAGVFDLTYTRFLDLKQAEAQGREAQIELALERVRARTMAMQHSDELSETAQILFQQFKDLGETPIQITIGIINEEESMIEFNVTDSSGSGNKIDEAFKASIDEPTLMRKIYNAWKAEKNSMTIELTGQELLDWVAYRIAISGIENQGDHQIKLHHRRVVNVGFFSKGLISISVLEPSPVESIRLLERFAKVFDQTYTRFLDLKQAEAQAREGQIELGLERVRARAMAMQSSTELSDLVDTVFKELTKLDFALNWCIINIIDESSLSNMVWAANPDMDKAPDCFHMKFENYPFHDAMMKGYQERATKYIYVLEGHEKKVYDEYLFNETEFRKVPAAAQDASRAMEKYVVSFSFSNFGGLQTVGNEPLSDSNLDILERFGKVFDLTYTRFNDLQRAEAQAREAQIQLALERVRARTMAMQHSDELKVAAALLFQQVMALGVPAYSCGYNIWEKDEKEFTSWMSTQDGSIINGVPNIPLTEDANFIRYVESKQNGEEFFVLELRGDRMQEHYEYLKTIPAFKAYFDYAISVGFDLPETQIHYLANFSHGNLLFITLEPCPEFHDVFRRFADVFDQTYTRFLDLAKAEEQAREAKIEAALERVRSRTMGMQKSEELKEVIQVVFEQFVHLNIKVEHTGFVIDYKTRDDYNIWIADPLGVPSQIIVPYFDSVYYNRFNEAKEKGEDFFATHLSFEEKNKFYQKLFEFVPGLTEQAKEFYFSCPGLAASTVLLDNVCLYIENFSGTSYTDEENNTLMRFGKVFQQTYTRFLDLQKAEAQTREGQIEVSLERVRSKAMAMHTTEDLAQTVDAFFTELRSLHVMPHRCGVTLIDKETHIAEITATSATENGESKKINGQLLLSNHPVLSAIFDHWKIQKEYHPVLRGTELKEYYAAMNPQVSFPDFATDAVQYGHYFFFKEGGVFAWTEKDLSEEQLQIFRKFTSVLSLTYRRHLDLMEAESQAKEAKIEAGLERVRSRTLAMQSSDELAETAAVVFRQLIGLGIAPTRLYIGIIHDDSGNIELWATDEDGSKVSTQFTGDIHRSAIMQKMYTGWKEQSKSLIIDMEGQELKDYFHYLSDELKVPFKLGLDQKRRVQNIAYFSKGFIGIASPEPQPEETTILLERFASVFNLTFTRFNDLKIAEHHAEQAREDLIKLQIEKKRAEDALTELRATQTQLIQSEKMASLGELTAGIAHEIQNPLNFVNNFSEVSNELIDEMNDELSRGDLDEAKAIASDIKQNLEKIVHHGKRADAIVKGMLMHSRTSSGTKEPTDINALADEYLRLAYHGLRAKDKTFNATMLTDFDPNIGLINIVPQDIGRVILNLITNAFYAVTEKKKMSDSTPYPLKGGIAFEPTVTVITKKQFPLSGGRGSEVEIRVKDNGSGIPKNVLDKIFQPFFTTKPTGQGTGLGLSLSYDIVKAHGGELKVETREGEGTTFIIQLAV